MRETKSNDTANNPGSRRDRRLTRRLRIGIEQPDVLLESGRRLTWLIVPVIVIALGILVVLESTVRIPIKITCKAVSQNIRTHEELQTFLALEKESCKLLSGKFWVEPLLHSSLGRSDESGAADGPEQMHSQGQCGEHNCVTLPATVVYIAKAEVSGITIGNRAAWSGQGNNAGLHVSEIMTCSNRPFTTIILSEQESHSYRTQEYLEPATGELQELSIEAGDTRLLSLKR